MTDASITAARRGLPGCSDLHIIMACPGHLQAVSEIGRASVPASPDSSNAASHFGEQVHALVSGELDAMSGSERASWVAAQCQRILDHLTLQTFGSYNDLAIWKETRFWLKSPEGAPILSGQSDRVVANPAGTYLLTDNKSLPGYVPPAAENWQLLGLACCLLNDDTTRHGIPSAPPINELYAAIIQPAISQKPERVHYTAQQLHVATYQIRRGLDIAKLPSAPRIPGTHCRYCAANATCPAALSMPLSLVGQVGRAVPCAPPNADKSLKQQAATTVASLTPAQLSELLPRLSLVTAIIEAARDRAKAMAATDDLPGYTLTDRAGEQSLTDLKAARELLDPYVTKEEFNALISIPVGALREIFVTRYAGIQHTTKVAAGKQFAQLIEKVSQRAAPTKLLTQTKPALPDQKKDNT
jgi:hypothetical protein